MPIIPISQQVDVRGSHCKAGHRQKHETLSGKKNTKAKPARGVAQMVEYLVSKREALRSNPNTEN
jgi:hypothetical protein